MIHLIARDHASLPVVWLYLRIAFSTQQTYLAVDLCFIGLAVHCTVVLTAVRLGVHSSTLLVTVI